jgi:DNA replication and repair protein RecF
MLIEHETAELASRGDRELRVETVDRLKGALAARKDRPRPFPAPPSRLEGWMEQLVPLHLPSRWRIATWGRCEASRDAMPAAGRTLHGPHLTDLSVVHAG